ncbi:MAG: hypothetical protein RL434_2379 [Pseudomonadota bacterium]
MNKHALGTQSPAPGIPSLLVVLLSLMLITGLATANDLTTMLNNTVAGLKTTITAKGICAKNGWRVDSAGRQLDTPCRGVTVTCPVGYVPFGLRKPYTDCRVESSANPPRYGVGEEVQLSINNRTATCNTDRSVVPAGYTPHCYYYGLLPGELAVVENRYYCELPVCNGSNAPCKPDNTYKVQLRGVTSSTPVCARPAYINNGANASCAAENISVSAKCIKRPSDAALQQLGIDITQ